MTEWGNNIGCREQGFARFNQLYGMVEDDRQSPEGQALEDELRNALVEERQNGRGNVDKRAKKKVFREAVKARNELGTLINIS